MKYAQDLNVDKVVGPEARGFMVGCPVAIGIRLRIRGIYKKTITYTETVKYPTGWNTGKQNEHATSRRHLAWRPLLVCDDLFGCTWRHYSRDYKLVEKKLGGEVVGLAFLDRVAGFKGQRSDPRV